MPRSNTVLRRQAREIIYNVSQHMKKEKEEGVKDVNNVYLRVANATGVSQQAVRGIMVESKTSDMVTEFRTPGKKRPRTKSITEIGSFDQGVMKRCIHNFHKTDKEMLTLKKLLAKFKKDIHYQGNATSLRKVIRDLGFRWRRTNTNKKVLIERNNIRLERIQYLEKISQYRSEGRPIVYMDKLHVHSSHTTEKSWQSSSNKSLKQPISKGQVVIVHAGSETGFVPNALSMFTSGLKTDDSHDNMSFENYKKWIETKLIPNLSPNSIVVIDNSPYHNRIEKLVPTSYSKKSELELWLHEKGVKYDKSLLKPELYRLIQQNKDAFNKYIIDDIFAKHNHSVLRLPPYHSDLNPIEMVWAAVKGYVALKNVECSTYRVMELVSERLGMIKQKEWKKFCRKVKEIEDDYRKSDIVIDEMTDQVMIISTADSSESESESECDTESDIDMPSTSDSFRKDFKEEVFMETDSSIPK